MTAQVNLSEGFFCNVMGISKMNFITSWLTLQNDGVYWRDLQDVFFFITKSLRVCFDLEGTKIKEKEA